MHKRMTREEAEASIAGLQRKIERYAELAVKKGAAVQPGQELVINAPVERADFARLLAKKGYDAGAKHVTVIWADDAVARLEYEHMDLDYFESVPEWKREQLNSLAADGATFLHVRGNDPNALVNIDPKKLALRARAQSTQCDVYRDGLDFGKNAWTIVGAPVASWAKKAFPDASEYEATYLLWDAILVAARADGPDPQAEWERHNATFEKNKRILNGHAFDRLHYRSANGTDLEVGMNPGHVWMGGACRTVDGVVFFPNIPTEEVFTSPDCRRINGVVHSVLPLVYAGNVIQGFWLRFKDGKVVEYDALQGKDVLGSILETDDRSRMLGECALVAKDTPIRQSGLLYYDTLFDENASCHLALGTGFPECLDKGFSMSKEELMKHGVNQSTTHVDFMIGADDLEIVGITRAGDEVPVFTDGRWSWSVD